MRRPGETPFADGVIEGCPQTGELRPDCAVCHAAMALIGPACFARDIADHILGPEAGQGVDAIADARRRRGVRSVLPAVGPERLGYRELVRITWTAEFSPAPSEECREERFSCAEVSRSAALLAGTASLGPSDIIATALREEDEAGALASA